MDLVYFNPQVRGTYVIYIGEINDFPGPENALQLSDIYPDVSLQNATEQLKKRARKLERSRYVYSSDDVQTRRRLFQVPSLLDLCTRMVKTSLEVHKRFAFIPKMGMWVVPVELSHKIIGHGVLIPTHVDLFSESLVKHGGPYRGQPHITFAQFSGFARWFTERKWDGGRVLRSEFNFCMNVSSCILSGRDPMDTSTRTLYGNVIDFLGLWDESKCNNQNIALRLYAEIGTDYLNLSMFRSKWTTSRTMYADLRKDLVVYTRNYWTWENFRMHDSTDYYSHYSQNLSGVCLGGGHIAGLDLQRCVVLNTVRSNPIASASDVFWFRLAPPCCPPAFGYLHRSILDGRHCSRDQETAVRVVVDHKSNVPLFVALPSLGKFVLFQQDTCCFWVMKASASGASIPVSSISIGKNVKAALEQAYVFAGFEAYREFLRANQPSYKSDVIQRMEDFRVDRKHFKTLSARPYYCHYPSDGKHLLRIYIPFLAIIQLRWALYKTTTHHYERFGELRVIESYGKGEVPELCVVELIVDASSRKFDTSALYHDIHPKDFETCVVSTTVKRFPFAGSKDAGMFIQRIREWDAFMDWATVFLGQDIWLRSHKLTDVSDSRFITDPPKFPWTTSFTFTPDCHTMMARKGPDQRFGAGSEKNNNKRPAETTTASGHDQGSVRDAVIAHKKLVGGVDVVFDTNILAPQFGYILRFDFDTMHKRCKALHSVIDNERTFENVFPFDTSSVMAVFDLYTWWRHSFESRPEKKQAVRK